MTDLGRSESFHTLATPLSTTGSTEPSNSMRARTFASLDALPSSYRTFLLEAERDDFFRGLRWFENFSQNALEPGTQIHVYAVEDDSPTPVPRALLLTRSPAGQNGSILQRRAIKPRTLASLTSYQSVTFAPVLRRDESDVDGIMQILFREICTERPYWSLLDLNLLDPAKPTYRAIENALRHQGMDVHPYVYAESIFERIERRSFKEFLKSRSSVVRKTFQRRSRNLERLGQLRFEIVQDPSFTERAIAHYERVCTRSWKDSEPFPKHAAGLIRASAAAGTLRLGFLFLDDEPIATQLWIVSAGQAAIYKLHYDENFKKHSVGSVLTARMLEHAIDTDQVDEIHFGVGNASYKRDWLHDTRPLSGLIAFNPRTADGLNQLLRYRSEATARRLWSKLKPVVQRIRTAEWTSFGRPNAPHDKP